MMQSSTAGEDDEEAARSLPSGYDGADDGHAKQDDDDDASSSPKGPRNEPPKKTGRENPFSEPFGKSVLPLELDGGGGDGKKKRRGRMESSFIVFARYFGAVAMAVILTAGCPDTKLRRGGNGNDADGHVSSTNNGSENDDDDIGLDVICLAQLILSVLLVVVSFIALHTSDPGYLTAETVADACEEDGRSLLGYEEEAAEGQEAEKQNPTDVDDGGDQEDSSITRRTNASTLSEDPLENNTSSNPASVSSSQQPGQGGHYRGTRRRLCSKCQFAPPLRAHHCKVCDRCVATWDHHCMLVGTCIGERNHCRFWWFLTVQLVGFLVCCSIVGSSRAGGFLWKMMRHDEIGWWDSLLVVLAKVYLYPLAFVALLMWAGHTFFAVVNRTSFECGKGPRHIDYLRGTKECDFPFSKGCVANLRQFCCQRDASCLALSGEQRKWKPILWQTPGRIVRDSEDWWEHPWQNKYWSCC